MFHTKVGKDVDWLDKWCDFYEANHQVILNTCDDEQCKLSAIKTL